MPHHFRRVRTIGVEFLDEPEMLKVYFICAVKLSHSSWMRPFLPAAPDFAPFSPVAPRACAAERFPQDDKAPTVTAPAAISALSFRNSRLSISSLCLKSAEKGIGITNIAKIN